MYVHIVMLEFISDAGPELFRQVEAYAVQIRKECNGVKIYKFAVNEAERSDGYTHAVVSAFENSQEHDAYQVSPIHIEMKNYMGPYIKRLAVFDGPTPT